MLFNTPPCTRPAGETEAIGISGYRLLNDFCVVLCKKTARKTDFFLRLARQHEDPPSVLAWDALLAAIETSINFT